MNLLTYLLACDVTDRLGHPSKDYKGRDEMQRKIMEQKAEIKRAEDEYWNSPAKSDCNTNELLKDINSYQRSLNRRTPRL